MKLENLGIPYISPEEEKYLVPDNELGKLKNTDVYQMVTERIIEQVQTSGHLPWQRPHDGSKGKGKQYIPFAEMPINYASLKPYRGINALMLMEYPKAKEIEVIKNGKPKTITVRDWQPITDGRFFWLTFNQIKEAGAELKKGSKSAMAVYYNWIFKYKGETISEEKYKELVKEFGCGSGKAKKECTYLDKIGFLKYYNVFNERDIEGVDFEAKRKELAKKNLEFLNEGQKILAADLLLKHMPKPPKLIVKHLSDNESPHYSPSKDQVVMPLKKQAPSLESWYGTCFHEFIHATGAPSRTDRRNKPGFERGARWGDQQYALEELVAEIGSVFLNAESGIMLTELKNNAVYIKGWASRVKKELQEDNKAIFKAASEAQKAAEYILDRDKDGNPKFWAEYKKEVKNPDSIPTTKKKKTAMRKNNEVTIIPLEVKIIKRYLNFHGKIVTTRQVSLLYKTIQKAATEKTIRKTGKYAGEIKLIGNDLARTYKEMDEKCAFQIPEELYTKLTGIANSYEVSPAISFIKRFINLYGDISPAKAKRLLASIANAKKNGKITRQRKGYARLNQVQKHLENYLKSGELDITDVQLNGFKGLAGFKTIKSKVKKRTCKTTKENSQVVTTGELAKMKFDTYKIGGKFGQLLGEPYIPFSLMIYGNKYNGKSSIAMLLANEFAKKKLKALYVSNEEGVKGSLQEKLLRLKINGTIDFIEDYSPSKFKGYDIVFIDSAQTSRMKPEDLTNLKKRFPKTSFVLIFKANKDGTPKGVSDWEHDVDAIMHVKDKHATMGDKNRFAGGSGKTIKIF